MSLTYAVVRCHGLIQHLLRKEQYLSIVYDKLSLGDIKEYSEYKDEYSLDRKLEIITRRFVERIIFLSKIVEDEIRDFLMAFLDYLELENLKVKLRTLYGKEENAIYYPYSHFIDVNELKEARTDHAFLKLLRREPYRMRMDIMRRILRRGDIALGEAYLDACYYDYVKRVIRENERTLKVLIKFLNYEILRKLAYWLLVLGEEKVYEPITREMLQGLMPYNEEGRHIGLERAIRRLGIDVEEAMKYIETGRITDLMHLMRERELRILQRGARRRSLSLVFIYYYIQLCREEMYNLYRIFIGKENNLQKEVIIGTLITLL
ncbi:MAG: hypothetical protein DRZ82_02195 [Thermoprotei archaeon]|nr:MAG: hypothetical protein DRZ82_02195 [Thermoprotei archaeon]